MSLLSHTKAAPSGALCPGSPRPSPPAAGAPQQQGMLLARGQENCSFSFFFLLFSRYFEELRGVQSAEAKLFKRQGGIQDSRKTKRDLAWSFLSNKSPYPNHRSRAVPGTRVCLAIQGVGICRRLGFAAINATGVKKKSALIHWHKQTGLILNRSNESCCDLGVVLRTFLPRCMDMWINSFCILNTPSILSRCLGSVLLKEDRKAFFQVSPISPHSQLWQRVCFLCKLWTKCTSPYF